MLSNFRNYIMPPSTDSDNDSVNPPLIATTTMALARMTTLEFNDITCPFDQFWDFSQNTRIVGSSPLGPKQITPHSTFLSRRPTCSWNS